MTRPSAPPPTHCAPRFARGATARGTCLLRADMLLVASALRWPATTTNGMSTRQLAAALHRELGGGGGGGGGGVEASEWTRRVPELGAISARLVRAFRPRRPADWASRPNAWLNTNDINAVMRQYDGVRKGFRFLGVFPMDFAAPRLPVSDVSVEARLRRRPACVAPPMCSMSVRDMLRRPGGAPEFGAVMNLDTHTQQGSHWVGLYGSVDPRPQRAHRFGVFYYDSVARQPRPEVVAWAHELRAQVRDALGAAAADRFELRHNVVRRQFQYTECGVFAMLFVIASVQLDAPFPDICTAIGGDAGVAKLRNVLYR